MNKPYYAIKALMPPTIVTSPVDGKRYAVSGSIWIPVGPEVTMKDVGDAWEPLYPRKKPLTFTEKKVKGSRGDDYLVKLWSNGGATCSCPGFEFRKKCRHIS